MSFDGLFMRHYVELCQALIGYRINRIIQRGPHLFILSLWNEGEAENFVISINPSMPYFTLSPDSYESFEDPTHWLLLLKRNLEGSRIVSIKTMGIDRILQLTFEKFNDIQDLTIRHLVIELTGRITNIILLKDDLTIIDAYKRIPPHELTKRTVHPGAPYKTPYFTNKIDPLLETELKDLDWNDTYMGISKPLADEINLLLTKGKTWAQIKTNLQTSTTVYMDSKDFHFIPFQTMRSPIMEYPWVYALNHFYHQRMEIETFQQTLQPIKNVLKKELDRLSIKKNRLQEDYDNALEGALFERYGTLLFTYASMTPKGTKQVTVIDEDTSEEVTIPLDPLLDLARNAQKYFKKYRKTQHALPILTVQLEQTQSMIDYFLQFQWQIDIADLNSLRQIKEELEQQGFLKSIPNKPQGNQKKKKRILPILQWLSPSGINVSIGKNNLQNEWLTFEKAQPSDIFLHVQSFHGSHVVIHHDHPDEETILGAAQLAAFYSTARNTSKVAVNYASVKTIKKIPGSPPGMIRYSHYQTVVVAPTNLIEKT